MSAAAAARMAIFAADAPHIAALLRQRQVYYQVTHASSPSPYGKISLLQQQNGQQIAWKSQSTCRCQTHFNDYMQLNFSLYQRDEHNAVFKPPP